jgi:hypothetical protein
MNATHMAIHVHGSKQNIRKKVSTSREGGAEFY